MLSHCAALPLDRPMLRVANALSRPAPEGEAGSSGGGTQRLRDVHAGLPPSKVVGGTVHLVDGSYEYFHYLQVRQRFPLAHCEVTDL